MNKLYALTEKHALWFALGWMCWHWGLLGFGFLPYPQPRLTVMYSALAIDALCFAWFFTWMFHWVRRGPQLQR